MSTSSVLDPLKEATVLAGLDNDIVEWFASRATVLDYPVDTYVIRESTPADNIYIILSGLVAVELNQTENPIRICEFGKGKCFGEAAVIGVSVHTASVVTLQATSLAAVSRPLLMELNTKDPSAFSILILNIGRELARRLNQTNKLLIEWAREHSSS